MAGVITALAIAVLAANKVFGQATYSFAVEKQGTGQPVLFIPGLISSGEVWKATAERFSSSHECHVLTLAGFAGQPPLEKGPYLETYKKDILRYLADNALEDVTVVGHSLGGYLGMMLALEQDSRIARLIVVDAMPHFAVVMNPQAKEGFDEASAKRYMVSFESMAPADVTAARQAAARGMTKNAAYWDALVGWAKSSDLKTEAYASHEMLATDLRKEIAAINIPVLALAAFDPVPEYPQYTLEGAKAMYAAQYAAAPNLSLKMAEGAKHFIMYDQPDWMYAQFENFLPKQ